MRALVFGLLALSLPAFAGDPYTAARAENAPSVERTEEVRGRDGTVTTRVVKEDAPSDGWGNAAGNQYDLVVDGAFEGQTVAVLQFYMFDFEPARAALAEKGFSVYRWSQDAPSPETLEAGLKKANQLWIISDASSRLTPAHLDVIQRFFESGHGVYIWGDNDPYYADANQVAGRLIGSSMSGDLMGDQTVGLASVDAKGSLARGHDITTGIEQLYEGITIATIAPNPHLKPLVVGSAGNLVTAVYDEGGKRAVIDGGFTRLYNKWDTAGTARYVKNAASWLANYERHGDAVLADRLR